MTDNAPATIEEYIASAPSESRPHLRRLHAILESVAPNAEQIIKWGVPFFIEPRFLFSFSAHKAHCNFAPSETALDAFRHELAAYRTTKNYLQMPYSEPVPENLVRRIAEHRLREVMEREDTSFW